MAVKTVEVVLKFTGDASSLQSAIDNVDKELGQLVKQTDRAQAALGVQMGKASQQASVGLTKAAKSTRELTIAQQQQLKASRAARAQYQNLGYQLQDTVVQLEMGTHWTRVLGQQGSQMAGIFGSPMLTILSAATFALLGLAKASGVLDKMFTDLQGTYDTLIKTVESFRVANDDAGKSVAELTIQYGTHASAIAAMNEQMLRMTMAEQLEDLASFADDASKGLRRMRQAVEAMESIDIQLGRDQTDDAAAGLAEARLVNAEYLAKKYGLTLNNAAAEARVLIDTIESIGDGSLTNTEAVIAQTEELLSVFGKTYGDASQWPDEAQQLYQKLITLSKTMGGLTEKELERNKDILEIRKDQEKQMEVSKKTWDDIIVKANELAALTNKVSAEAANWTPELEASRKASAKMADSFKDGVEYAQSLKDKIGEAEVEMLRLAGVDITKPFDDAIAKAIILTQKVGDLASAQLLGVTMGGPDAAVNSTRDRLTPQGMDRSSIISVTNIGGDDEKIEKAESGLKKIKTAAEEAAAAAKEAEAAFNDWYESLGLGGQLIEHTLTAGVDGFVDALFDAEKSFAEFARSFLIEIGKMIAKQLIFNMISGAMGGSTSGASANSIMKLMMPVKNANGNAFSGGNVVPFASGGVVNAPTLFPMSRGTGLMGEAGPEAIMPLSRGADGKLGVAGPQITINNNAGADIQVTRSDDQIIEIAVNRATQQAQTEFTRSMSTGQGAYARSLEQGYSARRKAT